MRIFRIRKNSGKSTQKQKEVKIVGNKTYKCDKCGYSVTIPYATEGELKSWVKENEWKVTDTECICPRCIALDME